MSEYQYYEFQTVDRRLSEMEMQALRTVSTRARITPTSFVNEYSFGDFKGNPDAWMEKYFDGFLYLANWGTHTLQLRVPAKALSAKAARLYCPGEAASVREKSGDLIFTFTSEDEEGGDWIEGEGQLSSLLPLRTGIISGDLRCLYLGWLGCVQSGELDDDDLEPPVPPNLGKLTGVLSNFVEFFRIDPNLIAVAAQASPQMKPAQTDRKGMAAWVAALPAVEKDNLLVRILEGENAEVGVDIRARFSHHRAASNPVRELPRRTVAELLSAAETPLGERRRKGES